jgi:DNA-binding SARP family transcriptional activator
LTITLLGPLHLLHHHDGQHRDITTALAPKQREVLTYLAMHPGGVRRENLTTALWPDAPTGRPYNALHATLSQLRRALRTATNGRLGDVIRHHDGHYVINVDQASVDLWHLHEALRRTGSDTSEEGRLTAVQRITQLYRGDLAEDLTTEWIETPREALRRDALDAISSLARTLQDTAPGKALTLLERARTLDRYNEAVYCDIARLQARLGQHQAISRTLTLLTTTLAELDEHPSNETVALCESLQHPQQPANPSRNRAAG